MPDTLAESLSGGARSEAHKIERKSNIDFGRLGRRNDAMPDSVITADLRPLDRINLRLPGPTFEEIDAALARGHVHL